MENISLSLPPELAEIPGGGRTQPPWVPERSGGGEGRSVELAVCGVDIGDRGNPSAS